MCEVTRWGITAPSVSSPALRGSVTYMESGSHGLGWQRRVLEGGGSELSLEGWWESGQAQRSSGGEGWGSPGVKDLGSI